MTDVRVVTTEDAISGETEVRSITVFTFSGTVTPSGGGEGGGPITAADITDATTVGRNVLKAVDAAAARTAIGAGTSSFDGAYPSLTGKPTLGTAAPLDAPASGNATSSQVVKGNDSRLSDARTPTAHTHTASQISDSTAVGRAVVTAADGAAARSAIGAGTSSLALGTSSSTAKAGDYQPASTNISDATTVGKALIVATDAAAARTAIGAGTSSLALGTSGTTAAAGNDSRLSDARTPTAHASSHAAAGADPISIDDSQVSPIAPNDQTGTTYTFVLADKHRLVRGSNASAITATVPPNSSVAYPLGTALQIAQQGAGQITVAAGAGVTLRQTHGLKTSAQYAIVTAIKVATDEWYVTGDTTT